MIQDILPDILNNHFVPIRPEPGDRVIKFINDMLMVHYDADNFDFIFPRWENFSGKETIVYLFSVNEDRYFLVLDDDALIGNPGTFEAYSLRELRARKLCSNTGVMIAFTAWHLYQWYRTSRFCGACGSPTEFDTEERAMACTRCGNKIYPRINPAVIVGVCNGDRILLTRYKVGYAHNALIAGFTEIGETMEETVRREVMEESGLKVKNIRYYKSQPWGIAADILMGFYCDVDGDDTIHRDDSELKYAAWVERKDIELQPDNLSLTNEMMENFKLDKI